MKQKKLEAILTAFTRRTSTPEERYINIPSGNPLFFVNGDGFVVYYISVDDQFFVHDLYGEIIKCSPDSFGCIIAKNGLIYARDMEPVDPDTLSMQVSGAQQAGVNGKRMQCILDQRGRYILWMNGICYYYIRNNTTELYCTELDGRTITKEFPCVTIRCQEEMVGLFDGYDPVSIQNVIEVSDEFKYVSDFFNEEELTYFDEKPIYNIPREIPAGIPGYTVKIPVNGKVEPHGPAIIISAQTGMGKNYSICVNTQICKEKRFCMSAIV